MDELDLLRLARPSAPTLDDAQLAAIKARALTLVDDQPASDALPANVVAMIELHDEAAAHRVRHRAALWLAAAACIVLIVGGLALARRHRDGQGALAGSSRGPDAELQDKLVGQWELMSFSYNGGGFLGGATDSGPDAGAAAQAVLGFKADGGGVALTTVWCGTVVSSGYHVENGRLVLADELSGVEAGCHDPAGAVANQELVALLDGTPAASAQGNDGDGVLTLVGASGRKASLRRTRGAPPEYTPAPTVAPSTTALAG